jgi:hypothetical protein
MAFGTQEATFFQLRLEGKEAAQLTLSVLALPRFFRITERFQSDTAISLVVTKISSCAKRRHGWSPTHTKL